MNAIFEIGIVLLLIVANGVFAMAEIALVSSKRPRLKKLADTGSAGAKVALEMANAPNRFLATVQVGITFLLSKDCTREFFTQARNRWSKVFSGSMNSRQKT